MTTRHRRFLIATALAAASILGGSLQTGCGSGHGSAPAATVAAPSSLGYLTNPAVYRRNTAIADNLPHSSGGAVASYSIAPALPAGLSLNPTTGVLSGTPTVLAPQATYTVTAANAGGSTACSLILTVTDAAPSQLAYAVPSAIYTKGALIAANAPSSSGGAVTAYTVAPALPAGLALDPITGLITGTPTQILSQATYTVTATNSGGSATCALMITVQDLPPSALAYAANPMTCYLNTPMAPNVPAHAGGTVTSYWVAPALPAGLLLNGTTGIISGTPLVTTQGTYRVTASNSGGSTTCDLSLQVIAQPPANLSYASNPMTCFKGLAVPPNAPSSTGGPVVSYTVAPALPAGLGLDPATGIVSGTPSVLTPTAVYVVTATNTGGSTTANLTLRVVDQAPTALVYATNPSSYTLNQPIQPNLPSHSGGAITSYAVSPALPAGLALHATTGVISGTPTAATPQATYLITGSNATGSTTCAFVTSVVGTPIAPPATPIVTTVSHATAAKAGYLASTQDQGTANGMGYVWTLDNGTLTGGQGTPSITFTAGAAGPLSLSVKATNLGGSATGTATVTVVAPPAAPLFAQGQAHYSNPSVLASVPPQAGTSYLWTLSGAGAGVLANGTTHLASYSTGLNPGSYQLSVDVQNLAGDHTSSSRSLDVVANAFLPDPNGAPQRKVHSATVLRDGRILVAGGEDGGTNILASALLYDPYSGTWAPVGSMAVARRGHTATLLLDGRVLVTGGLGFDANRNYISLPSAELFDPATQTWTSATPMSVERDSHTATRLANGKVLVAGGVPTLSDTSYEYLDTAEIYDPGTDSWSDGGLLTKRRANHSATLLPNGKVLLAGGETSQQDSAKQQTTDLFDPTTGKWTAGPNMPGSRVAHTADLLGNGKVLVAGGFGSAPSTSAILFDPAANGGLGAWSPTANAMAEGRYNHQSVQLPSGKMLMVAGAGTVVSGRVVASAALYDPAANLWSNAGSLAFGRAFHSALPLPDGRVIAFGGDGGNSTLLQVSAELYDPALNYWSTGGGMAAARHSHATTPLLDGTLLVAGGNNAGTVAESFDPATGRWSSVGSLLTSRQWHGAARLADGRVLVAGGWGGSTGGFLASAETYLPTSKTWAAAASMATPRRKCTATTLTSGKVLVVGGESSTYTGLASAELYDPATNTWTSAGNLAAGRYDHTATLLPNGKVLVAGGRGSSYLNSAELYDPATNSWTQAAPMLSVRQFHTATLLSDGRVLVAGGTNGVVFTASVEVYDAAANAWTPLAPMNDARGYHAATLLPDNQVLVTAGYGGTYGPKLQSAERFNPATGIWTPVGSLLAPRRNHTATALGTAGLVLVVGGEPNAFAEIWKP